MKTKEEILTEHGCPVIPFDENVKMYYPAILEAMEEYATQQVNLLNKTAVSKCGGVEREALLLAFAEFLDYETFADLLAQPEYYVKRFLANNSC